MTNMKVYQEITLLPSADIPLNFIWEKMYQQIHLALVECKNTTGLVSVGAAFPEYNNDTHQLGKKLRLFASDESDLEKMDVKKWVSCLADFVHVTGIRSVPEQVSSFVMYKRVQFKTKDHKIRHSAKRNGISLDEAAAACRDYKDPFNTLSVTPPFVRVNSRSTQKKFRLFIAKEVVSCGVAGAFNPYGLSQNYATVPEF